MRGVDGSSIGEKNVKDAEEDEETIVTDTSNTRVASMESVAAAEQMDDGGGKISTEQNVRLNSERGIDEETKDQSGNNFVVEDDASTPKKAHVEHEFAVLSCQNHDGNDQAQDRSSMPPPPLTRAQDVSQQDRTMAPISPGAVFQRRLSASSSEASVGPAAPMVSAELVPESRGDENGTSPAIPLAEASPLSGRPSFGDDADAEYLSLFRNRRVRMLLLIVAISVGAIVLVTAFVVTRNDNSGDSSDVIIVIENGGYDDAYNSPECDDCFDTVNNCTDAATDLCVDLWDECDTPCFEIEADAEYEACLEACSDEYDVCLVDEDEVCDSSFETCKSEFCE